MNFNVIDSKHKQIWSGKVCQALNLVHRVDEIHVDANLKEILDRHPGLQSASGAMPGTYSTVPPVVHGPRRQPAVLLSKIVIKLKEMAGRASSHGLGQLHGCLKSR